MGAPGEDGVGDHQPQMVGGLAGDQLDGLGRISVTQHIGREFTRRKGRDPLAARIAAG